MNQDEIKEIKNAAEELLQKMTVGSFSIDVKSSAPDLISKTNALQADWQMNNILEEDRIEEKKPAVNAADVAKKKQENIDAVDLEINLEEPQFLIGQGGQTLFSLERVLRLILDKKLKKHFYLKLDINGYKKKKIEYLKKIARDSADEVSLTGTSKTLPPMPAYERRIVHMELAQRKDVTAESQGEGFDRRIVINPA